MTWILIATTVNGKCGHSFHMASSRIEAWERMESALELIDGVTQHCLMTWIHQDSSKGLCPMCRQSNMALEH